MRIRRASAVLALAATALVAACGTEPVNITIATEQPTSTPAPTATPQRQASVEASVSTGQAPAPTATQIPSTSTPVPESQVSNQIGPTPTPTRTPLPTGTPRPAPSPTPTPDPLGEQFFLSVLSPASETVFVSSPRLTVSGRTTLDAVVSVDDQLAEVNADGSFEVTVQLEEGPNLVEVIASNTEGEEKAVLLTIIYVP